MLPKKNRLNKKVFNEIFKNSKTYSSESLYLKVSKNTENDVGKFAFVVPTKVSKLATERNKLRRQGYNIINKHLNEIKEGSVVIFFLKKEILRKTINDYEMEIISLLKNSNLIKKTKI